MKFKLSLKRRLQARESKLRNWSKNRAYQRFYMRTYRKSRPEVIKKAQKEYIKRLGIAFPMYHKLVNLIKVDGLFQKTNRFMIRRRK